MYDSLKPVVLVGALEGNFLASFLLGWTVTTGAGIASYPLDTIRRRMMMTSGEAVKYSGSMDAARKIFAAEGIRSFFKGAGANILRGVAGAGVLSIYDRKCSQPYNCLCNANNSQRLNFSCSARPSRVDLAKLLVHLRPPTSWSLRRRRGCSWQLLRSEHRRERQWRCSCGHDANRHGSDG